MESSIDEFWERAEQDCEHAYTDSFGVVVCEYDVKRRIMCCNSICPRPRWTREMIDEMYKKAEELKGFIEEK